MPRWRYTIDIKQHLNAATHGEEFFKARAAVADELKKARDYDRDYELRELVEELEGTVNAEDFNYVLSAIYDWADAARVWLGL